MGKKKTECVNNGQLRLRKPRCKLPGPKTLTAIYCIGLKPYKLLKPKKNNCYKSLARLNFNMECYVQEVIKMSKYEGHSMPDLAGGGICGLIRQRLMVLFKLMASYVNTQVWTHIAQFVDKCLHFFTHSIFERFGNLLWTLKFGHLSHCVY